MYRYPFTPFPNGWFRVALSEDVPREKAVPLVAFGKDLVAFRGADGEVRILDAHCPHLGAHLGHGGRVEGNTIVCPFHAWRFDAQGACTEIPYCTKKIPKRARIRPWTVCERNGHLFVWYHAEGAEPDHDIPVMPEWDAPGWSKPVHLEWTIRMHIQEIAENAVDFPHFETVHAYTKIPAMHALEIEDHRFRVEMTSTRKVMGIVGETDIDIEYFGLGVVHSTVITQPIDARVILTSTPVDRDHVNVHITVWFRKTWNPVRNWAVLRYLPRTIEPDFYNDIPLWENKLYHERPVLCADDGPIMSIRKWARQFYSATAETPAAEPIPLSRAS